MEFLTKTLEALLTAPLLRDGSEDLLGSTTGKIVSLAELYPGFGVVPAVNSEVNELFRLSRQGKYRYAIGNLLNLMKLLDVLPHAGRKEKRLIARRDTLLAEKRSILGLRLEVETADDAALTYNVIDPDLSLVTIAGGPGRGAADDGESNAGDLRMAEIDRQLQRIKAQLAKINPRDNKRFRENVFRYGTFMSDVVSATGPGAVEAALNTVALPVGSSQIKRSRDNSLELGAYFGASFALEELVPPAEETLEFERLEGAAPVLSLFVPVGLSYSQLFGGRQSFTVFASVLDLGALTAFRLEERRMESSNLEIQRLPEFTLRNVVAPGLHLMYNVRKTPVTLGVGVQDGPGVREYSYDAGGEFIRREARSVRFMVTASVDVPIFRLGGR